MINFKILADGSRSAVHDGWSACAGTDAGECNAEGHADGDSSRRPGLPADSAQWANDETTAAATAAAAAATATAACLPRPPL